MRFLRFDFIRMFLIRAFNLFRQMVRYFNLYQNTKLELTKVVSLKLSLSCFMSLYFGTIRTGREVRDVALTRGLWSGEKCMFPRRQQGQHIPQLEGRKNNLIDIGGNVLELMFKLICIAHEASDIKRRSDTRRRKEFSKY